MAATRVGGVGEVAGGDWFDVGLTEVTHLTGAGVQVLHRMRDQLAGQGGQLVLPAPPDSFAHAVLDLVHLPHTAGGSRVPAPELAS